MDEGSPMSTAAVADRLGITKNAVHQLVRRGRLVPCGRIEAGRHGAGWHLFNPADVEQYAENRSTPAARVAGIYASNGAEHV